MLNVNVKTCTAQPTDRVGVTLYSTDVLDAEHTFQVADVTELRKRLAEYNDVGDIVFINGVEYGPSYAAADNLEWEMAQAAAAKDQREAGTL